MFVKERLTNFTKKHQSLVRVILAYLFTILFTVNPWVVVEEFWTLCGVFYVDTTAPIIIFAFALLALKVAKVDEFTKSEQRKIMALSILFSFMETIGKDVSYQQGLFRDEVNKYSVGLCIFLILIGIIVFNKILQILITYTRRVKVYLKPTAKIHYQASTKEESSKPSKAKSRMKLKSLNHQLSEQHNQVIDEQLDAEFSAKFNHLSRRRQHKKTNLKATIKAIYHEYCQPFYQKHLQPIVRLYINSEKVKPEPVSKQEKTAQRISFLKYFVPIAAIRLIFFCVYYPGVLTYDSMYMLMEGTGIYDLTNAHPYLYVYIIGIFIRFGMKFLGGIGNGVGLFNLLVLLFTSGVFAYALKQIFTHLEFPRRYKILMYLYFMLNPFFIYYSYTLYKDVLLVDFLILYVMHLIGMMYNSENYFNKPKQLLYFSLSVFGIYILHRKAIIYILVGYLTVFLYNKAYRKIILKFIAASFIFCLILDGTGKFILDPIPSHRQYDYLATRYQQVAAVVKKYPDFYSEDELEVYDKIFNLENTMEDFNPKSSDPIKNDMNNTEFKAHKDVFKKMWLKGYKHHPKTYIDAVLNLSVSYWYPYRFPDHTFTGDYNYFMYRSRPSFFESYSNARALKEGVKLKNRSYSNSVKWFNREIGKPYDKNQNIGDPEEYIKQKEEWHKFFIVYLAGVPLISILYHTGIYTWVLLFLLLLANIRKNKKVMPLLLLSLSIVLSCVYSPIVNYFRYAYLLVVIFPMVIPFVFIDDKIPKAK